MRQIPPYNPTHPVRLVTASTALTVADRLVRITPGASGINIDLESAPPDGTTHTLVLSGSTFRDVAVHPTGTDTIIDGATTTINMGGHANAVTLQYKGGVWDILGLAKVQIPFRWETGSTNDYLQQGQVSILVLGTQPLVYQGGALSTAMGLFCLEGTVVTSHMRLQTRTNVGANHTITARVATNTFGSAADFTNTLTATITTGNNSVVSTARNVLDFTPGSNTAKSWIVLQANTNISTRIDGILVLYIL